MSPYEIFLDARVALCQTEEWNGDYPQPVHLANELIQRADMHLGIRSVDGYMGKKSVTNELMEAMA